ncbi:uncharacterized protein TNCV_1395011 [Trichonephila clavipes]|nr:uncharacterized protein TNCV_1395011 [Trichonephila clavipes]
MHPYRIPIALQQEVDRQINELLHLKLIEPSESEWAHPIVCVSKKNGILPLTKLTKNRVPNIIPWNEVAEQSFTKLKAQLVKAPSLYTPDLSKPYQLYTDASATAIGACLSQNDEKGKENPIVFSCGLAIHQNDHQARRSFVEWAQNEIAVVPDFHKRILFSDEAHFWLNGYVNKQNCRIWSEANPQVYVETPLYPEQLTVWCALWAGGIIGPYFFKNDEVHNVTVNGDRYRALITNFFIPELNNHDVQELWFQQGATCHTALATIDLLKDTFCDLLISRFGPVNWPPRSCHLTPLDYFL